MKLAIIWIYVTLTAYNPVPAQTDSTPDIGACGPVKECTVAVSRDLHDQGFTCGRHVFIYGVSKCGGIFQVWDKLHWRKTDQLDILFLKSEIKGAIDFGVQSSRVLLLDF